MGMRLHVFAAVVLTAAASIAASGTAAQAAPAPGQRHCVIDLARAGTPMSCYTSFATAISAATAGRISTATAGRVSAAAATGSTAELDAALNAANNAGLAKAGRGTD